VPSRRIVRIAPGPGQESVWDYPRPPRAEQTPRRLEVIFAGEVIAQTVRGWRVIETSASPVYYFPPGDVRADLLRPVARRTHCEFKGTAHYFDVVVGARAADAAAWVYPVPSARYAPICDHVAFYPHAMDACLVDGERARPQPGGFYGGWVTDDVVGPFKGGPGTQAW